MAERQIKKPMEVRCEDCLYYDMDDETGDYECTVSLDEDDYYRYSLGGARHCPYYRYYDEYKSVQKQN